MAEVITDPRPPVLLGRREPRHSNRSLQWHIPLLLTVPLLLFMLAFYAVPVLSMLLRSLNDPTWSFDHYPALFADVVFLKVFWVKLRTSLIVTLATLALGYPVALALSRGRSTAPFILIIILLPFWTSVLVRSYAWMVRAAGPSRSDQRGAAST